MEKKLTIRDIAELSGVAKSTVSRYLNGGCVREETGRKIKKVIEAYHYEPNVFARLSAKNSRIIGLIVPGFDSIVTPGLVEVIVAYLKRYDYTPLIMHTGNDLAEEIKSIERLTGMNVDGIMVLASSVTKSHEAAVEKANIPVLFLGQRYCQGTSVINDDYHAGLELGRYLGAKGASHVAGLWVSEQDLAVGRERKRGVQDGLKEFGIEEMEILETSFFYQDAVKTAESLFAREVWPDTVVCATDRIAEGVYKVLYQKKARIPEDVSVTGFGDYETSELLRPPLTTIRLDLENWGEISAEIMLQMVQGKPVSKLQINSFALIERDSVAKRR
ncbi:LacI family transcriptional regulator [bacterium 1XD21-13]|nr:LacI family transcriptional regulator [bacterium 1XD21-13]